MTSTVLVVVGLFQVAFIIGMLALLVGAHRRGRVDSLRENDATDALRDAVRALVMGDDRGEALAAALARLDREVAARQVMSIALLQLAPEQMRDLVTLVRPSGWVRRTLAGGTSRRWWKRMEAARLLVVVNSPEDLALLARLVCDPHPAVASAATAAISSVADPALISTIIEGLHAQPAAVRLQQMRALRSHAGIATVMLIARLDESMDTSQMRALVQFAEALGTPGALAAVVRFAASEDAEVRATVARALRSCFMPAGVAAARMLLNDTDWRVRAAAARALAGLNAVDAVPELQDALRDESWWVRFRAALALGALGERGTAALSAAETSDDAYARDMAHVVNGLSEPARLELSA